MTVAWKPDRRRLVWAGVGVVAVAVFGLLLWLAAGFASTNLRAASPGQSVPATVLTMAPCNGANAQDTVSFTAGGQTHQAKLDSCGDSVGQTMNVLVPAGFADGTMVEPAAAAPGDATGLLHRVSFVMLALVAVISGGAVYYFFSRRGGARLSIAALGARPAAERTPRPAPDPGPRPVPASEQPLDLDSAGYDEPADEPDQEPISKPGRAKKLPKVKALRGRAKKGRAEPDEDDAGPLSQPFPRVDRVATLGSGAGRPDASDLTETAEVNWFEDSITGLPIDLSQNAGDRADRG